MRSIHVKTKEDWLTPEQKEMLLQDYKNSPEGPTGKKRHGVVIKLAQKYKISRRWVVAIVRRACLSKNWKQGNKGVS